MFKNRHFIKQYNPRNVGQGPQVHRRLPQPNLHVGLNRLLDPPIIIHLALIPARKTTHHQD
jgi:hypothetical protein